MNAGSTHIEVLQNFVKENQLDVGFAFDGDADRCLAGSVLIDYIRPYYQKAVFHADRDVKFELATLGNDAGIYGAAKLVLDR